MRLLIITAIGLGMFFSVAISAVTIVKRLNPGTNSLDAIGLTVCNEMPCFREVSTGMVWADAQKLLEPSASGSNGVDIPINVAGVSTAYIATTFDHKFVSYMTLAPISASDRRHPTQITAGEIVTRFGTPCFFLLYDPATAALIYPHLTIVIDLLINHSSYPGNFRPSFEPASPVYELQLNIPGGEYGTCESKAGPYGGPWRGFISVDRGYLR